MLIFPNDPACHTWCSPRILIRWVDSTPTFEFTPITTGHIRLPDMTFLRRGQAHNQGQNWWPNLKPNIQSICNITFLVPSQSNHTFWYNKFSICPCKFTVNGMAKTKIDGFICSPSFNRYVCLSFHIANSTFSLRYKQLESNPWQFKVKPRWKLIATFEA